MIPAAFGLDVTPNLVRAVAVDAAGSVLRVASQPRSDAAEAVKAVAGGERNPAGIPFGVASDDRASGAAALSDIAAGTPAPVACRAAEAAVVAEVWTGAAKGARHAVCLWCGDRVLAGLLLDGAPWSGAHDLAGSAAWLALNPVERQDYRKFGNLAAEVSDLGIARRLAWRIQAGDPSAVLERAGSLDAITTAHVFDAARAADGVAISVVLDTARYIGMAAANLAVAVDPEVVVIGGPIMSAADLLLEPVRQEFARRLPPSMVGQVRCEFSPLGENGIAIGAARLAMLEQT